MNHDTPGTECAASPLRRVLILGCGVIGGNVLDLLSRLMPWLEITIACRTEARLLERVNLAAAVAMNVVGTCPRLSYRVLDLADVSRTSDLIDELKPQVVINATSLQTFWEISTLPQDAYLALNEARIGPWIPNHLALAWKLMRAVKATSQHPFVINTAFPDSVNPVLAQAGLAPSVGAGNLANAVPTLRRAAAKLLDTDPDRVEVRFVAHHYVGNRIATYGDAGGAPFHLSILADGAEVTGCLDTSSLFRLFVSALRRQRGVPGQVMAASSVVAVLRAMCSGDHQVVHAPGPDGLVGGYPITIQGSRVVLQLPESLTLAEAQSINSIGQQFDGIERIASDGTVHFAPREMSVLKKHLGYECRTMPLSEVDHWASELRARYAEYKRRVCAGGCPPAP